jgi:hypothetical protein
MTERVMKSFASFPIGGLVLFFLSGSALSAPEVIGYVERVILTDHQFVFDAKIDTGADNTSMHIDNYKLVKKDGVNRIRFEFTDKDGEHVVLERKLIKITKIKRKLLPAAKRPVISLFVCVGGIGKEVPVNLVNRGKFRYKVLIGRSFLKGSFLVDSGARFTTEPSCKVKRNKQ